MGIEAKIVWNIIPEFTAKMNVEATMVKERALAAIAARARELVRVETGETRDSIIVNAQDDTVEAGSAALFLEYGTVKMPAYPFLGPATSQVQTSFAAEFAAMWQISSML
jgi:HK97 gp10 family phage protein